MISLILTPNFNFELKKREAGDYLIVLPQVSGNIIVWSMWCSSLRWAVQDANCDFNDVLDVLFGKDNWEIIMQRERDFDSISNEPIELEKYLKSRRLFKLPPWEVNKEDKYQNQLEII